MSIFFDRFSSLCKDRGESPNSLAKKLGVSSGSITAWKKGAMPRVETMEAIADYFNIDMDYLYGRSDTRNALLTGENTRKAPTPEGERKSSDDEIKFALFGTREIDDDVLDQVKQFAKFARENRKDK